MFDVFGADLPLPAKFFIAFAVVLALIGVTAWLVRRFGANRLGGAATRGRQPRLAVIDATAVDARRRLVLIRRDNVEHLLMIGGPTDVVVEPNIVRAVGSRDIARETLRASGAPETSARPTVATESAWPLQPAAEPAPVTPPRSSYRAPASEEPWHAPEPGARPRPADSLTGLAAELSSRLNPPDEPRASPRSEPTPRAAAPQPAEPAVRPQDDHNLADMALQLEAALRRNPMPESRTPVTDPLAVRAAEPRTPLRDTRVRLEPRFEAKPEPAAERRPEPRLDIPPSAPAKETYANLEEEMASLLGRPVDKS